MRRRPQGADATRPVDAAESLLRRYVRLHNDGVRSGAFEAVVTLFAEDATLEFVGVNVGPFRGRGEIRRVFQTLPPDDELILLDAEPTPTGVGATYAWRVSPQTVAGRLEMIAAGDRIAALRVSVVA